MSAETTLYSTLSGHAGLTAIVGSGSSTRIYPDALPEECEYPAVVFSRSATDPLATIHGAATQAFVTMAISAWGETRASADATADAVQDALLATGEVPMGRTGAYDPEAALFSASMEVTLLADM